jgi:tRNA 2-thiouridine synthesizing protein A
MMSRLGFDGPCHTLGDTNKRQFLCVAQAGESFSPQIVSQASRKGIEVSEFDTELDVRGLKCPLPILRTKKVLASLTSGAVLKIVATDPGAAKDFEAFARQTGHELLTSTTGDGGEFVFLLRRK